MTSAVENKSGAVVEPAGRLKGKVALITGATQGIGPAIAAAYAREGAKLVLASGDSKSLRAAKELTMELGADTFAASVLLKSQRACDDLFSAALHQYGRIDVAVLNHATLGPRDNISNYPLFDWEEVMNTNLNSYFFLSRSLLGTMIPNNYGSLIYVGTSIGIEGSSGFGAYAASKGAVEIMAKVISMEAKPYGVRANIVTPGPMRTENMAKLHPNLNINETPKPEELVNAFIYLGSDISKGVTGNDFNAEEWVGRQF